jgi:hypothetical protein
MLLILFLLLVPQQQVVGTATINVVPANHVMLAWSYSIVGPYVEFQIYRANGRCGQLTPVWTRIGVNAQTFYRDDAVSSGQAYCYRVTAAFVGGQESAPSPAVEAVIP